MSSTSDLPHSLYAFDSECQFFATAQHDGRVKVFSVETGKAHSEFLPPSHLRCRITSLCWNSGYGGPDGVCSKLIALGTDSGNVFIWDHRRGELKKSIIGNYDQPINACVFDPISLKLWIGCDDGNVSCWFIDNNDDGGPSLSWKADSKGIKSLSISNDGKILVTGSSVIKLFDTSTKKSLGKFSTYVSAVTHLKMSSTGSFLLSASAATLDGNLSGDRYLNLWPIANPSLSSSMTSNVFSLDGCLVYMSLITSSVSLPNSEDKKKQKKSNSKSFRTDMDILGVSETGSVYIWRHIDIENFVPQSSGSASPLLRFSSSGRPIIAAEFRDSNTVVVVMESSVRPFFETVRFTDSTSRALLTNIEVGGHSHPTRDPNNVKSSESRLSRGVDVVGTVNVSNRYNLDQQSLLPSNLLTVDDDAPTMADKVDEMDVVVSADHSRADELIPVPKADSSAILLSQALKNKDRALLEECIAISDISLVSNTVARLPSSSIIALLEALIDRFRSKPTRGAHLIPWIRSIFIHHTAYIISVPVVMKKISELYQTIQSRVSLTDKFARLSGRLDLVLSQAGNCDRNTRSTDVTEALINAHETDLDADWDDDDEASDNEDSDDEDNDTSDSDDNFMGFGDDIVVENNSD